MNPTVPFAKENEVGNARNVKQRGAVTLEQRRAFLELPLAERRRRMAAQAKRMAKHYERKASVTERERWQGGDIVEA
jgi:hypothetical protein